MEQSTKLFIALAMLFILYATMKGHLQSYLALLWGGKNSSSQNTGLNLGSVLSGMNGDQSLAVGQQLLGTATTALQSIGFPGAN